MRIAHVVTLVSPDNAYGGPVRVALNQLKALADRGHEVTLFAGSRGFDEPPSTLDGVPVRAFPVRRVVPAGAFSGLHATGLHSVLRKSLPRLDCLHVHLARDLITLPAARLAISSGTPLFLQTHGMISASEHPLAGMLDALLTRTVLTKARKVYYLNPLEHAGIAGVVGDLPTLAHLPNGVPTASLRADPGRDDPEFLFLARLHPQKRPRVFVEAALSVLQRHPNVRFAVVGPDEGEAGGVDALIASSGTRSVVREGALGTDATLARMARSQVYVLPSVNEAFGMSVVEAMSVGLPVVVTDSCGLAEPIAAADAGLVVDDSRKALEDAMERLAADPILRLRLGENARRLAHDVFSMDAVATILEAHYADAATGVRGAR